jgi:hypothetical protein
MHSIDNGHSYQSKRDNWIQINNYLKSQIDIKSLKNENIETIIDNKNNEVVTFVIKLYQELTNRRLPVLAGTKFKTDIDDKNKSYLLKETGELELLTKIRESRLGDNTDEATKTLSKCSTSNFRNEQ